MGVRIQDVSKKVWHGKLTSINNNASSDVCMCYSCSKFSRNGSGVSGNCPIANSLFKLCVDNHISAPVIKCAEFIHRDNDYASMSPRELYTRVLRHFYGNQHAEYVGLVTVDTIKNLFAMVVARHTDAIVVVEQSLVLGSLNYNKLLVNLCKYLDSK